MDGYHGLIRPDALPALGDIGLMELAPLDLQRLYAELLGEGLTNSEIAPCLFISTKTAGSHVSNVLAKQPPGRAEAAAYAVRYIGGTPAEK